MGRVKVVEKVQDTGEGVAPEGGRPRLLKTHSPLPRALEGGSRNKSTNSQADSFE